MREIYHWKGRHGIGVLSRWNVLVVEEIGKIVQIVKGAK
jgi:hypothetical protein